MAKAKNIVICITFFGVGLLLGWYVDLSSTSSLLSTSRVSSCSQSKEIYMKNTEFFVMAIPRTMNRWKHLRAVLATGPYPLNLVDGCTPDHPDIENYVSRPKNRKAPIVLALLCSHYRAIEMAFKKNLDHAVILEDDALLMPDFWGQFDALARTLQLATSDEYGVVYLQHPIGPSIFSPSPLIIKDANDVPMARKFAAHEVFQLGAGLFDGKNFAVYDAGGYVLSKKAIQMIVEFGDLKKWIEIEDYVYSSEAILSWALGKCGGAFSIPPLIYQCNSKASLVQDAAKSDGDREGRNGLKTYYAAYLRRDKRKPFMPPWFIECGFEDRPKSANKTC